MRVLFVVSRMQETRTVFKLAEIMAEDGCQVLFLFIQEGCRHSADLGLMRALNFAGGVYVLREDCRSLGLLKDLAEGVKAIDYDGWVDLLEACGKVVSWT